MQDKNPFEEFINGKYADASAEELKHIVTNAGSLRIVLRPDVHEALAKLSDAARQSIQEAIQRQLADPDNLKFAERFKTPFNETGKLSGFSVGFTAPLDQETYNQMRDAINAERIERLRRIYGDEWVKEAEELARTRGIAFAQAVTYLQMRDRLNQSIPDASKVMQALAEAAKAFTAVMQGERMPEPSANDVNDFEPDNRHTRRASKHARRVKEGDQSWKTRRRYRNRH